MIQKLLSEITTIYMAYGATDFRKQIPSLCAEVRTKFNLNPCDNVAFINSEELKKINKQQLDWLLSGLKIEQEKSFKEYKLDEENTAI